MSPSGGWSAQLRRLIASLFRQRIVYQLDRIITTSSSAMKNSGLLVGFRNQCNYPQGLCARRRKTAFDSGQGNERDDVEFYAGKSAEKETAASGMRPFAVDGLQGALCEKVRHFAQRGLEGDAAHLKVRLLAGDAHCVANKLACEVDGVVEAAAGVDGGA